MTNADAFFDLVTLYLQLLKDGVLTSYLRDDCIMLSDHIFHTNAAGSLWMESKDGGHEDVVESMDSVYDSIVEPAEDVKGLRTIFTDVEYKLVEGDADFCKLIRSINASLPEVRDKCLSLTFNRWTFKINRYSKHRALCLKAVGPLSVARIALASEDTPWFFTGENTSVMDLKESLHALSVVLQGVKSFNQ